MLRLLKTVVMIVLLLLPPDGYLCVERHQDAPPQIRPKNNSQEATASSAAFNQDVETVMMPAQTSLSAEGVNDKNSSQDTSGSIGLETSSVINAEAITGLPNSTGSNTKTVAESTISTQRNVEDVAGSPPSNTEMPGQPTSTRETTGLLTSSRHSTGDTAALTTSTRLTTGLETLVGHSLEESEGQFLSTRETPALPTSVGQPMGDTDGQLTSTKDTTVQSTPIGQSIGETVGLLSSSESDREWMADLLTSTESKVEGNAATTATYQNSLIRDTKNITEYCFTWWHYNKRWFYPCRESSNPMQRENEALLKCLHDIRNKHWLSSSKEINILNLLPEGAQCGEPGDMYAEICILVGNAFGIRKNFTRHIKIHTDGPTLTYLHYDVYIDMGIDFSNTTAFFLFTIRSQDECGVLAERIDQGLKYGGQKIAVREFFLPYMETYCLIHSTGDTLYPEHCVATLINQKADSNCSKVPYYALERGYTWASCINSKPHGFCLVEGVEDTSGKRTLIYRTCLKFVTEGPTRDSNWKSQLVTKCLEESPSRVQGNQTSLMEMDIHEKDTGLLDLACFIYGGFYAYTGIGSILFTYIHPVVLTLESIGLLINFLAAYDLLLPENRKSSANIYLAVIVMSNMLQVLLKILGYVFRILSVFDQYATCSILHALEFAVNDLLLLLTLALSVERCIAICKPFLRVTWCTVSRSVQVVIASVVITVSMNSLRGVIFSDVDIHFFIGGNEREGHELFAQFKECFLDTSAIGSEISSKVNLVLSSVTVFIPWSIIVVLNIIIVVTLRRHQQARSNMTSAVTTDISVSATRVIARLLLLSWIIFIIPNLGYVLLNPLTQYIPNPYKHDVRTIFHLVTLLCLVIKLTLISTVYLGGQGHVQEKLKFFKDGINSIVSRIGKSSTASTLGDTSTGLRAPSHQ